MLLIMKAPLLVFVFGSPEIDIVMLCAGFMDASSTQEATTSEPPDLLEVPMSALNKRTPVPVVQLQEGQPTEETQTLSRTLNRAVGFRARGSRLPQPYN